MHEASKIWFSWLLRIVLFVVGLTCVGYGVSRSLGFDGITAGVSFFGVACLLMSIFSSKPTSDNDKVNK